MEEPSIVIVGAGIAGLATGCYARMNGYRAHIVEHHALPGGVVAAWRRGDYLFDGCIHYVMGHKPGQACYDLYRELGIAQACRYTDMSTYARVVDEASGRTLDVTADLDRFASDCAALSPADAKAIAHLVAGAQAMRHTDLMGASMANASELMGCGAKLKRIWRMRRVLRYFGDPSVAEWAKPFHDPFLRSVVENLFLPEVPVWFVMMILGLLANGQLGLLDGGSDEFARAIAKRYVDLGGEATYKATVEEILVENGRAVSIRLADGTEHRADIVVSAADGRSTLFRMLKGRYLDSVLEERYRTWQTFRPIVMASFGVAQEFKGEPWRKDILLARPFRIGSQEIRGLVARVFNYSTRFAPPGKTVVQAEFETEWDWWNGLHADRPRYQAEKQRVAAEVLDRLEPHYPGIGARVEVTDVATPYTTWRYTRNDRGAFEGWLPTPDVITAPVRRTLPGLASFYMAGQWVVPGGGLAPCLYSGRHVVQLLCHRDGKRFTAEPAS